jgi:hypothetical protein
MIFRLVVVLVLGIFISAVEARQLCRYKELTASVADSFKCSEKVTLTVTAPDDSAFKGDRINFQRLVGSARAVFGFECDKIKNILIHGMVGNKQVYQGISSAAGNWVVMDIFLNPVEMIEKDPVPSIGRTDPTAPDTAGSLDGNDYEKQIASQLTAEQPVELKRKVEITDWTTKLIGTWQGKISGQDVELSIWIPKYYNVPGVETRLSLYMQTMDGKCTYGDTMGHPPSVYAFNLPSNKDVYEEILLRYYFMPDVFNESRSEQDYCSKNRDVYPFLVYYEPSTGQVFAHSKGYQPGSNRSQPWPLKRANPSRKLSTFLNGLERQYGATFFGAQKYLLLDKTVDYSSYKERIPVSCEVPHRFALAQIYKQGISGIEAFPVSGNDKVEVKFNRMIYNGDGKYERSKNSSAFYSKDLDIDWANLSMRKPTTTTKSSCKQARTTLTFLPYLNQKTTAVASSETPKLKDINDYYLINQSGIDQIKQSKTSTLGSSYRMYGGNTIFVPGDKTRQFRWDPFSQKMVVQNYIKSIYDNKIVFDSVNKENIRKFVYDATLSQVHGVPIFASTTDKYEKDICVEWQGQISSDSCTKIEKRGKVKNPQYLTSSEKTAIELFKKVSPQNTTWKGLSGETGRCPDGPFCELPGGDYLNAIFRGDFPKIREIDNNAFKGLRSLIKKVTFGDDKFYSFLTALSNGANESLLPLVVDEYMYTYQQWAKDHCLDADAVVVEKNEYVPGYSVKEVYSSGAEIEISRTEGYMLHATYVINPEFWQTCQRFCGVQDSKTYRSFLDSAVNRENAMIGKLYMGLKSLKNNYDCRSREVQIFEKNLIELSRNYYSYFSSRKFQLSSW